MSRPTWFLLAFQELVYVIQYICAYISNVRVAETLPRNASMRRLRECIYILLPSSLFKSCVGLSPGSMENGLARLASSLSPRRIPPDESVTTSRTDSYEQRRDVPDFTNSSDKCTIKRIHANSEIRYRYQRSALRLILISAQDRFVVVCLV